MPVDENDIYRPRVVVETRSRPRYETKANVDYEMKFCAHVNDTTALTAKKIQKKLYPCDIIIERDKKIVAFVEYKRRLGAFGYADGIILSLDKASRLIIFATLTQRPVLFMVEPTAGVYYGASLSMTVGGGYVCKMGGRYDRGDIADTEPLIYIPKSDFLPLSKIVTQLQS